MSYVAEQQRPRPAGDVRVQRRSGSVVRVPARRRRRPAARRLSGGRNAAADAAAARPERRVLARVLGSRLRRPGRNGLQPDHREGRARRRTTRRKTRRARATSRTRRSTSATSAISSRCRSSSAAGCRATAAGGRPCSSRARATAATASAASCESLQETAGVGLNGAILISPALEFGALVSGDYDVLRWIDRLPTMAGAAAHHGRSRAFERGHAARRRAARGRGVRDERLHRVPDAWGVDACRRPRTRPRAAGGPGRPSGRAGHPCRGAYSDQRLRARAPARRAEGARALRRDDHRDRPVPGPRAVRRPGPDARGHRVRLHDGDQPAAALRDRRRDGSRVHAAQLRGQPGVEGRRQAPLLRAAGRARPTTSATAWRSTRT